ncbi:42294_t:CDS:2, partial [Gigaspora margarita]
SRDNSRRFSKTAGMESSDSGYSDSEYSDSELLVYESEDNYEEDFNNKEMELNEKEQRKNKGLREAAQGAMSLENFFKPVKKLEIKNKSHRIHEWSKSWIMTETLPVSKQGQRKYTQTLIDDENVQSSCLRFICTMGEKITAEKFQNYVQNNILLYVT